MLTGADHARLYLDRLHGHSKGYIEIRALMRREIGRQFFDARWPLDAVEYALGINQHGYGVYCGVNPLATQGGYEKNVAAVGALFLDVDTKKADPERNHRKLCAHGLEPSMTVVSGNGAHFYFILEEAVPCADGKLVGQRLCDATDSDRVFNTNRIARVPGTLNWKTDPPNLCFVASVTPRNFTLSEISTALDRMGIPMVEPEADLAPTMQARDPVFDWIGFLTKLDAPVVDLIKNGEKHAHFDSRSEADYRVVRALVTAGATDHQIYAIYSTEAIGRLKYREKGQRYLETTIRQARRDAAQPITRVSKSTIKNGRFGHTCRHQMRRATW